MARSQIQTTAALKTADPFPGVGRRGPPASMPDFRLGFALVSWAALLGVSLWPVVQKEELSERKWRGLFAVFCLGLALLLPLWRWHSLTYQGEINVDEGSEIALGLKYLSDPIPWRSVDGITCGPLSTWVFLWAPLAGVKLSYFTLRLTALVLIHGATVATVLSIKEMIGKRYCLLCIFPAVTLFATTLQSDFLSAALEYVPVALSSLVIYLLLRYHRSAGALKAFLVGGLTGAMPFSKLQSAPSAIMLFFIGTGFIVLMQRGSRPTLWKHLLWITLGGLAVPTLILVPVMLAGAWFEFLHFYIVCGMSYRNPGLSKSILEFLVFDNFDFGVYGLSSLAASTAFLLLVRRSTGLRGWLAGLGLLAGYGGVLVFSVMRSGFYFSHYLILLIMPTALVTAWVLRAFLSHPRAVSAPFRSSIVLGVFGVLTLVQFGNAVREHLRHPELLEDWGSESSSVAPVLLRYAKPGDSMAIWGWANNLHAITGIRPATRFIGTAYVTHPSPQYDRHRKLFLEDLKKDKPRLFVDAIDEFRWPGWPPGALARHDMLPELSEWVRREYSLVDSVRTDPERLPVLIYVRKDR